MNKVIGEKIMNELKFNSQVCTSVEQSQRLLELGLKPETADMSLTVVCGAEIAQWVGELNNLGNIKVNGINVPSEEVENIPAWSLHRLIELGGFNVECKGLFWRVTGTYFSESCDKIYDTIIDSIEALITENLFNKEYLKQRTK